MANLQYYEIVDPDIQVIFEAWWSEKFAIIKKAEKFVKKYGGDPEHVIVTNIMGGGYRVDAITFPKDFKVDRELWKEFRYPGYKPAWEPKKLPVAKKIREEFELINKPYIIGSIAMQLADVVGWEEDVFLEQRSSIVPFKFGGYPQNDKQAGFYVIASPMEKENTNVIKNAVPITYKEYETRMAERLD